MNLKSYQSLQVATDAIGRQTLVYALIALLIDRTDDKTPITRQ